jgi:uracil-DNA glycosylase
MAKQFRKYMDDDDEQIIETKLIIKEYKPKIMSFFINCNKYGYKNWNTFYANKKVSMLTLVHNTDWHPFFEYIQTKPYFARIEQFLQENMNKGQIVPYPELLFLAFNLLSPNKIKVVIIGQDPYPGVYNNIPNAMGACFSVPYNCGVPVSLVNIFKNMKKFGHIKNIPEQGCLTQWILQGVFLLNASLTTFVGQSNVHKDIWKPFTDDVITYITEQNNKLLFLVWGASAHYMCLNVNPSKHNIITSSHPSNLGNTKTFKGKKYGDTKTVVNYPPFNDVDHFGMANKFLKQPICWWFIN